MRSNHIKNEKLFVIFILELTITEVFTGIQKILFFNPTFLLELNLALLQM